MRPEFKEFSTKYHRIKTVYRCVSQYSSACDIITNVEHQFNPYPANVENTVSF